MKKSILIALIFIINMSDAFAQILSQDKYFELTEQDSSIKSPIILAFHEGSIIIESDSLRIYSRIKRKKKRGDNSIQLWLENKFKLRLYFDSDSSIKRVFIYADDRTFFISA